MADQKAMKKRLKALMQRPENQVCSDCPEKRPTWASLIVPPPGAPPGTEKIGSFMCLECSGSHRRLGVHISFVRSVNLDSWKEWEVRAMENGGNAKVNAIFEATLAQSGRSQPSQHADGPTRERYVRDKYERRKFYDPAGFSMAPASTAAPVSRNSSSGGHGGSQSRPGAPSDIARRRVASRQARMKPQKTVMAPKSSAPSPAVKVAQAPVSAPVEFDLLDFGSDTTTPPAPQPSFVVGGGAASFASFPSQPAAAAAAPNSQTNQSSSGARKYSVPPPPNSAPPSSSSTSFAQELFNNPAPETKTTKSNNDIMALFGPSKTQQNQQSFGFGMQAINQMGPNTSVNANSMMGNTHASQQQNINQQTNMMVFNNQQNMMAQQQQMMMMQNNNKMGSGNCMMPNQMQQQMMQQQMMMMQQQQQMGNQPQPNNTGSMNNMGMYNAANNINSAIQGMQNMHFGNSMQRQTSDDGGFGAPMGGGSQQQTMKKDAFSSLGGMNAFR